MSKARSIFIAAKEGYEFLPNQKKYWKSLNYATYSTDALIDGDKRAGLSAVLGYCDAVCMVRGWERNSYCRAIHAIAVTLSLDIYYEEH